MVSKIKTVSDLIDILESFKRRHGDKAAVAVMGGSRRNFTLIRVENAEVLGTIDSEEAIKQVNGPTLLLW